MNKAEIRQDLSNTNLQVLPKVPPTVTYLSADNNLITSLTNLPPTLSHLSLAKNKISFLGTLSCECKTLLYLDLSYNRLISLEGIQFCRSLQELRLNNNYIGDDQIQHIQSLADLRVLDVSHNHLRDKKFLSILGELQSLEKLQNKSNDFSEWKMTKSLKSIENITLDSNKIRRLEISAEMPKLSLLSAKENNISTVTGIQFCRVLAEIDFSGNDLSEISDEFSGLKKIRLKNNSLTVLPKLRTAEVVDVSHNMLLSILNIPLSVRDLNVSHNSLSEIPNLPYLEIADFSYNKLTHLTGLDNNKTLINANFSQNLFPGIGPVLKSLKNCRKIKSLNLEGIDLKEENIEKINELFPVIEELNSQPFSSFLEHRIMKMSLNKAWDSLSKSKLFPSCRSSLAEIEKNIIKNEEFSMFSDLKSSLSESLVSCSKEERVKMDTEYELLAKELDINDRIKKLDLKTKQFGDSLISRKEESSRWQIGGLSDSLISRKDSSEIQVSKNQVSENNSKTVSKISQENLNNYIEIAQVKARNTLTPSRTRPAEVSAPSRLTPTPNLTTAASFYSNSKPTRELVSIDPSRIIEKEDSTISFNISNEVSKEPVKFISDKTKRSKCCKHCCKRRRKSINTQTTMKTPPGQLIDQATSPMNSIIKLSPVRSFSRLSSETDSKPSEKSPTPCSNRSYMTEPPPSRLPPKGKDSESIQLLNYASTAPRPILSSEGKVPILCSLNTKGAEFFLVSQIFLNAGRKTREVIKTYTFDLQKKLRARPDSFLSRSDLKNILLFYKGEDIEVICNSPDGFSGIDKEVTVYKDVKEAMGGYRVLICLSNLDGLEVVKNGVFRVRKESLIIPVYIVEFN